MPTVEREDCRAEKKGEHDHDHGCALSGLMRRVHSIEDLLKKLRWERSVVDGQQQHSTFNHGEGVHVHIDKSPSYEAESCVFEMPVHYPRFSKEDYGSMPEWRLDLLFHEYGLAVHGDVEYKRDFAKGTFLWPDQY